MDICTIEHLPPEILELIFQELSLKDISNCAQTCQHWNYCIEAFFRNQGMYYLPTKSPYCLEIHFRICFLCCYLLAKKTQSFYQIVILDNCLWISPIQWLILLSSIRRMNIVMLDLKHR